LPIAQFIVRVWRKNDKMRGATGWLSTRIHGTIRILSLANVRVASFHGYVTLATLDGPPQVSMEASAEAALVAQHSANAMSGFFIVNSCS
jgi:hypothetical protein